MVNGRGQLGSFEFHMLENLNLPQFPYLQNKVTVAPVLFGENSVKTHVRHLAGPWNTGSVQAEFIWDVALGSGEYLSEGTLTLSSDHWMMEDCSRSLTT